MRTLFKAGVILFVLGLILFGSGVYLAANAPIVEETTLAERGKLVWFVVGKIGPGRHTCRNFTVPSDAQSPVLELRLSVLSGGNKDVDIIVETSSGGQLYRERVAGYVERTIQLPGAGTYRIIVDNSFSMMTSKLVEGTATLRYKYPEVIKKQAETVGDELGPLGLYVSAIGAAVALATGLPGIVRKAKGESQKA